MKKLIFALLMTISLNSIAQNKSTTYTTFYICSQESYTYSSAKQQFERDGEAGCNDCKIMYNDYYIRVFENNKEIFTISKEDFYRSTDYDQSTFFQNKHNNTFMQLSKNGRWVAFGKNSNFKLVYNVCENYY